ncbi:kelch motif-containing protein [Streptomyces sp. HNM0663]|uniref:Kelch motif-containing protein n=1 Tax=Streptomyces chengmaiensis TaxID=3040919 RepID=A0ABT6HP56_9ACTN|nr:kelch motif-containing protein [Streptomyces chengmaiensis]MDH2390510.1 kelch motif-containing protein [Streptomyces chengmaiensis]
MSTSTHRSRRARRIAVVAAVVIALAGMNGPALWRFASEQYHEFRINRPAYKAANGHWELLDVPGDYRINTIHAALLHTGKVLLIAGSGNDQRNFDAKKFESVLWDPETGEFTKIPTPKDMFCAGHTQLPDGRLLVAGGTKRYEKLKGDVTKAGGLMIVHNEDPDAPKTLPAGTRFTGRANGRTFVSKDPVLIERAEKTFDPATGRFLGTEAGLARVYVEAERAGKQYQTGAEDNYRIHGLTGDDRRNVYGTAQKLALDKKDFQGIREAFEFDPVAERYVPVDPMNEARWYPTLTTLEDGRVLALSGLDEIGQIVPGKDEIYDPGTKKWTYTGVERRFPTYPAIFLLADGRLFYSGSNAGYGPADVGRDPGVWDLETDAFERIPGLSDPDTMETSATVMLPPAQDQRFMVIGGGGVGESRKSTAKSRLVDLKDPSPRFRDGPSLDEGTRYPSASLLPDDTVLVTGGSRDYRGRSASNILQARLYDPESGAYRRVADPGVGRNYHSGSVLLPDGRVMIFGSDSLFADKANTRPGAFEQRIELYSPPYLHRGPRPELTDGPTTVERGGAAVFRTAGDPSAIRTARLLRPSAVTHVTDVDQRAIALKVTETKDGEGVRITVPGNRALVPSGWYMLFVTDGEGRPSKGVWVQVR